MLHFLNFPASCCMTDFEIVEPQNDMLRRAKRIRELNLTEPTPQIDEQNDQEIEDINIIANVTARLVQQNTLYLCYS